MGTLWNCSTGHSLAAFPTHSSPAVPHTLSALLPYFKPHNSSGLWHFPARAPSNKAQLAPLSRISFPAPIFSTVALLHQTPRLSPIHRCFFHCCSSLNSFSVPRCLESSPLKVVILSPPSPLF